MHTNLQDEFSCVSAANVGRWSFVKGSHCGVTFSVQRTPTSGGLGGTAVIRIMSRKGVVGAVTRAEDGVPLAILLLPQVVASVGLIPS